MFKYMLSHSFLANSVLCLSDMWLMVPIIHEYVTNKMVFLVTVIGNEGNDGVLGLFCAHCLG